MWAKALKLLDHSERLHRQFFHLNRRSERGSIWEPPIDVFESDQALTVLIALPGVSPLQVEVLVDGGALFVVGERPLTTSAGAVIRRLEIPYGRFERRIDLPPGHFEIREQTLVNGSLRLSLRKLV